MGSLLSRSSSNRTTGRKSRWRKEKGKRFEKMETSIDGDHFQNDNVQKDSNGHLVNTHDEWNNRIDQQQITNINGDLPGVTNNYSTNFPMIQNDLMTQSWTAHHDSNNQFYQGNAHSMATISNIPYDPNQYVHTQIPDTFMNQPQKVMLDERLSKKVQFAHPIEQYVQSKTPLTATQSLHELNATNTDSTARQDPVLTRQTLHRSLMPKSSILFTSSPMEKPIYVGIDHKATLAERGQTTANKYHHKNNGDTTNNPRSRSHTHHQHKHQESNDTSTSKSNPSVRKSLEPLQAKLSGTNRQLTTTSTSTITPNKSIQHTEQHISNDNEIKTSKTRSNRNHTEQKTLIDNDTKPSRSRRSHKQQSQQQSTAVNRNDSPLRTETVRRAENTQQNTAVNRNNSPLRTDIVRRGENTQQGTPVMRIPVSLSQSQQQRQKQLTMPSTMITTANITRTRV